MKFIYSSSHLYALFIKSSGLSGSAFIFIILLKFIFKLLVMLRDPSRGSNLLSLSSTYFLSVLIISSLSRHDLFTTSPLFSGWPTFIIFLLLAFKLPNRKPDLLFNFVFNPLST